jgi:hypothetical protein
MLQPWHRPTTPCSTPTKTALGQLAQIGQIDMSRYPLSHRIVGARQPPGQMSMKTFNPSTRAAHAPIGLWTQVIGLDKRISFGGVKEMSLGQPIRIDDRFRLPDPSGGFETTDGEAQVWVNKPVASGHGGSVAQKRRVGDHGRLPIPMADDHSEMARGRPS